MKTWTTFIAAGLALAGCAADAPRPMVSGGAATTTVAAPKLIELATADGRTIPVRVTEAERAAGVILFSHGGGTDPAAMQGVVDRFVRLGYSVVAPTHTDSLAMVESRRTPLREAFATRLADMQVVAAHARQTYPGLPMAVAGYSYGSLFAAMGGGALEPMVPGRIAGTRAVVMFSSPGEIPGLTSAPGAFAKADAPSLLVTGSADVVPGIVTDPKRHRIYFDTLPAGGHMLVEVAGASHEFVRGTEPGWDEVAPLVADFLAANLRGDAAAATRLAEARSGERLTITRR